LWQLKKLDNKDPKAEFEHLFSKSPDGITRNRPELFDGTRQAGVYIGENITINADVRRRVLTFYELATSYGRAWHNRFQTTYFTAPDNINVLYWPDEEYILVADKKHNPKREPVWTGLVFDQAAKLWMISYVTPIDIKSKHKWNCIKM